MWLIISLVIVGVFLLVAELVLLPGLSVAGICALIAYGFAIYLGFDGYGTWGGVTVIAVIVGLSAAATAISLRAKTWQRFSLKEEIDSSSQITPENHVSIGDRGKTVTRLNPMGKVTIAGDSYEAKSLGDLYLDQNTEVEVVGFENFNIIVKKTE